MVLFVALGLGSIAIIGLSVVISRRRVPVALPAARPHQEAHNRQRVIASLARIVPASQRVRFDPAAFVDVPTLMQAMLTLCGADGARFVAAHTAEGEQQSHSVSFEKHTFRATVPASVDLASARSLLGLINGALNASSSARRVGMLFDQQHHWFAVLEPGFAARLQRVGVSVEPG